MILSGGRYGTITYITGGARSGKSSFAERLVEETKQKKAYVATGIPFDNEMKIRVEKHREQRGKNWTTIESYRDLKKKLETELTDEKVILLDCITNLVTNIMIIDREVDWDMISKERLEKIEQEVEKEILEILEFGKNYNGDIFIVSNELGMGLVPPYALGRHFRDICGRMNQIVAQASDTAYLLVSGLPIKLK